MVNFKREVINNNPRPPELARPRWLHNPWRAVLFLSFHGPDPRRPLPGAGAVSPCCHPIRCIGCGVVYNQAADQTTPCVLRDGLGHCGWPCEPHAGLCSQAAGLTYPAPPAETRPREWCPPATVDGSNIYGGESWPVRSSLSEAVPTRTKWEDSAFDDARLRLVHVAGRSFLRGRSASTLTSGALPVRLAHTHRKGIDK